MGLFNRFRRRVKETVDASDAEGMLADEGSDEANAALQAREAVQEQSAAPQPTPSSDDDWEDPEDDPEPAAEDDWDEPEDDTLVYRGGSFFFVEKDIHSASRISQHPNNRHASIGFRLARSFKDAE